jgi:type IV pilus assembly protein PilV
MKRSASRGAFLLEALVALIVLSLGLLGVLGLLAGAMRASGSAQWRSEGFDVAAAALARISTDDPAGVAARYDPSVDGPGYRQLLVQAMRLPGVSPDVNAPIVSIVDGAESRHIRVIVRWQLPGEGTSHKASVSGALPHR